MMSHSDEGGLTDLSLSSARQHLLDLNMSEDTFGHIQVIDRMSVKSVLCALPEGELHQTRFQSCLS